VNLAQFFDAEEQADPYSEKVCDETRRRIKLSVAAYAYEYMGQPTMTDAEFDKLATSIDLSINTRRPDLDDWFRKNFAPHTGMWIHKHPERYRLKQIANMILNEWSKQ
jgi:hypothetical protein